MQRCILDLGHSLDHVFVEAQPITANSLLGQCCQTRASVNELRDAQHKLWRAWRYLRTIPVETYARPQSVIFAMEILMQACVRIVDDIHKH